MSSHSMVCEARRTRRTIRPNLRSTIRQGFCGGTNSSYLKLWHRLTAGQITSRFDGVIKKLYYEPDDMAKVGKVRSLPPLLYMETDKQSLL
jgi:hypothetical protein